MRSLLSSTSSRCPSSSRRALLSFLSRSCSGARFLSSSSSFEEADGLLAKKRALSNSLPIWKRVVCSSDTRQPPNCIKAGFATSRYEKKKRATEKNEDETKDLLVLLHDKRLRNRAQFGENINASKKQRAVTTLYRKLLRKSKRFPDPTLRHFGYHRVGEQFRRHRHETGRAKISIWKKEATKQSRRMERALRGDRDDYRHFLELAYGVKGRMGHAMRRFEEERKVDKTRRQEKFLLTPIDRETMETFSVKTLLKMTEDASLREGAKFEEQMDALKRKVPTFYGFSRDNNLAFDADGLSDEKEEDDDIFAFEDSRDRSRATEDAIDALELGDAAAEEKERKRRSKLRHWHVHDDTMFEKYAPSRLFHGYDANWESNHVALLKCVFEQTLVGRLDQMPRKWFRTYRRTLFEDGEPNSNKNKNEKVISSNALEDVQRTTPLRIVVAKEGQREQNSNDSGEEDKSSSKKKSKEGKSGAGIKLAESTIILSCFQRVGI